MHVVLEPDLEQLVSAKVAAGKYPSANDVVRAGLHLLEEREQQEQVLQEQKAALQRDIAIGLAQAEYGETLPAEEVFVRLCTRNGESYQATLQYDILLGLKHLEEGRVTSFNEEMRDAVKARGRARLNAMPKSE